MNLKLNFKILDNEIQIILNEKIIGNIKLDLFSGDPFKNLEEINLSNNNISNIEPLKNFDKIKKIDLSYNKINQLKMIDLSFNKIQGIGGLKDLNLSSNKIEEIEVIRGLKDLNLSFNKIEEIGGLQDFNYNSNFSVILKEIQNIKLKIDNLLKHDNIESIQNNKLRIFGEGFVKNNKSNCIIFINNKEKELNEFYEYSQKEKVIFIKLEMNEKVNNLSEMFKDCSSLISFKENNNWNLSNITDMSYMFYNCSSLASLPNISKWTTSNVINMNYLFYNCFSLIPFPDISNWNISKVNSKIDMLYGCLSINNKTLNKFK